MFTNIPFTNGKYSIDKKGNVKRNDTQHILSSFKNNKGYDCIDLRLNNETKRFLVHRLVAITYIPNPNGFDIINHKDSNPSNNDVENLEWCTSSHNNKYAYDCGNRVLTEAQISARRKPKTYLHKKVFQYDKDGNFVAEYASITEASIKNDCSISTISSCLNGRNKTGKGFIWKHE